MSDVIYDVIIVGAGISGISCANTILNSSKPISFKIISPELGGKLKMSENNLFGYGPYYVREDYYYSGKYFERKREITWSDFRFHDGDKFHNVGLGFIKYYFSHLKFKQILAEFYREYDIFKKKCLTMPQCAALKSSPYLYSLYQQNGQDFVDKNFLKNYFDQYISYVLQAVSFSKPSEMNAFHMLSLLLPLLLIVHRYEIKSDILYDKIKPFCIPDSVKLIKKQNALYEITTDSGFSFTAKKVVVALPPHLTKSILNLTSEINKSVSIYVFHLSGTPRKKYVKYCTNIFKNFHDILVLTKADGNIDEYMLYAKIPNPPIEKLFSHFNVIKQFSLEDCFHFNGSNLIDFEQEKNLYVIGDHNVNSIEDACIYGCYAGEVILKDLK